MALTHLLYLHGFRSSPLSTKARRMAALMARDHPEVTWWCPQLPPSPQQAMQALMDGIAAWQAAAGFGRMAVMGSSLGGFYATLVAERTGCQAVLLNPAVHPARDLLPQIGAQTTWQNPAESFFFEPGFVEELRALEAECAAPLKAPDQYLAVLAKGDEVLDWREMTARYAGTHIRLLEGGDHALSDFDDHLPAILEFLGLA